MFSGKFALAIALICLILNPLAVCQSGNSVQSRPIVIRLPSPSAVENRQNVESDKDDNKDKGADIDISELKKDKENPKDEEEEDKDSENSENNNVNPVVTPVTPSSFKQENSPVQLQSKVATASDISQFLNPSPVVSRFQPGSLAGGAGGLNPPVPGLLASQFGNPQTLPGVGAPGAGFFGGSPGGGGLGAASLLGNPSSSNGILGVLQSLGKQLTGAVGLNNLIPQSGPSLGGIGPAGFPQARRLPGGVGPPIAGLPNIPGLPLFPGGSGGPLSSNGQIDFLNLFSAISRRAFNGTSLSDILPPNQAQQFADNITETLLPNTVELDLAKFMGRWFEGINSPRATDQRCVVHHYGGLTENGKTATFTALKIYREGSEFGQVRYSIGYAFKGGRQDGMLQMHSSEATDPTPYWIYRAGPVGKDQFGNAQYEYAVISNWIRYPVVVLVRDPDQFRQKYEEDVLRWLEDNQFINGFVRAFNLVQPADYANCQYADSTFEIFG